MEIGVNRVTGVLQEALSAGRSICMSMINTNRHLGPNGAEEFSAGVNSLSVPVGATECDGESSNKDAASAVESQLTQDVSSLWTPPPISLGTAKERNKSGKKSGVIELANAALLSSIKSILLEHLNACPDQLVPEREPNIDNGTMVKQTSTS